MVSDILRPWVRHFRAVVLIMVVGVLGAGVYLVVTPPVYVARSKMLVQLGREKFSALDASPNHTGNITFYERVQDINNEIELVRDPRLLDRLVPVLQTFLADRPKSPEPTGRLGRLKAWAKAAGTAVRDTLGEWWQTAADPLVRLGLLHRLSPDESFAKRLTQALVVTSAKEADIIIVEFGWSDPAFAAFALNEIVSAYRKSHIAVQDGHNSGEFYRGELARVRGELDGVNAQLLAAMRSGHIVDADSQRSLRLQAIGDLERQRDQVALAVKQASLSLALVRQAFTSSNAWVETPSADRALALMDTLDKSYADLVLERSRLAYRYPDGSPQIQEIDTRIRNARRQKFESLQNLYASRVAEQTAVLSQLDEQLAGYRQSATDLAQDAISVADLQQKRDLLRESLASYSRKLEALQIDNGLNADSFTNVSVISPAAPPFEPSYPRKGIVLGLAAFFSALASVTYVQLASVAKQTVSTQNEVEQLLTLPVLAVIPEMTG